MRWDIIAKDMHPANDNDARWSGFEASLTGETTNPFPISGPNGEDVLVYWFWGVGWWYCSCGDSVFRDVSEDD